MADDIVTRGQHYYRDHVDGWMARTEWGAMQVDEYAAALLDEIERLRAAIDAYLVDTDSVHQPEWASEQARANGKEPWCCTWCGAQDGGWPCGERLSLDELKEARRG